MSSAQGIAGAFVMTAALGAAGLEAIKPPVPIPPVIITQLEWDGERIVYERDAAEETLASWSAVVLPESDDDEICGGGGRATYEAGKVHFVRSLDWLTNDHGCRERIPPGKEVYVLVTITPLDGGLPYSKRSGPFKVKPTP